MPDSSYCIPLSQSNLLHHRTVSIKPSTRSTSKSNHQDAPVPSIDPSLQPTSQITDISNVATLETCSAITQVIDPLPMLDYPDLNHATLNLDLPTHFPASTSIPFDSHRALSNSDIVSHSFSTEIIPAVSTSTFDPFRPLASPYTYFISSITVNLVSPSITFASNSILHEIPSNSCFSLVFFVFFVLTFRECHGLRSRAVTGMGTG